MKAQPSTVLVLALLATPPVQAHRLDEYLQATTISVEKGRISAQIRLAPGVAVFPQVFAEIDRDGDGVASQVEQERYARRVLGDVKLTLDDTPLAPRLVSSAFAPKELLAQGRGEIRMAIEADAPRQAAMHRLTFENHHQRQIGVYLVNGLVPADADIRVGAQQRNSDQSFYQLDYRDSDAAGAKLSLRAWADRWTWLDSALAIFIAGLALVAVRLRGRQRP
jgi:hypothetical protein